MTLQQFMQTWLARIAPSDKERFIADAAALCKPPENTIWVGTLLSLRTGEGLVELKLGPYSFQTDVQSARKIAGDILDAFTAAEGDEAIYHLVCGEKMGLSPEAGAAVLADIRQYREQRARQRAGADHPKRKQ